MTKAKKRHLTGSTNKGGRPTKDALEKRSVVKPSRFTEEEGVKIQAYLVEHGLNYSDFARQIILKEIERDKQRKKKTSSKPKETRFPRPVYRTAERLGRSVNSMAFAFNAAPDRPPAAERMAFMLDELKPFVLRLMAEFPKHYRYDVNLWRDVMGIDTNIGQIIDSYELAGLELPPKLADTQALLGDMVDRLGAD